MEVSVIMPTYNRASLIKDSVTSILSQTHSDLELIIVSDGSTDNTKLIIESFQDDRIKFVELERNYGYPAKARNIGLELATGKYIAFCDDDDLWVREKLEKQLKQINRGFDVCFSGYRLLGGEDSTLMSLRRTLIWFVLFVSRGRLMALLSILNPVCNSSVLISSKIIKGFSFIEDINVRAIEDYLGWIELFKNSRACYSLYPLVLYRVHDSNISANKKRSIMALNAYVMKNSDKYSHYWRSIFLAMNHLRLKFL